jgi:two-component system nitrogen regulation sensor histidine kinase NtrY
MGADRFTGTRRMAMKHRGRESPAGGGRRSWTRAVLLAALVGTPLLPSPGSALAAAVLSAAWLAGLRRASWIARGAAATCLVGAVAALAAPWAAGHLPVPAGDRALQDRVGGRYAGLWAGLSRTARTAAAALPAPGDGEAGDGYRREAFERLTALAARADGATLLLVDPDGEAVAWAGPGLLIEPEAGSLPRAGLDVFPAFGSATLVAIEPLDGASRPWRVVAGRSFPTDRWPFRRPASLVLGPSLGAVRWSLATPGTPLAPGAVTVSAPGTPGAPSLVVLATPADPADRPPPTQRLPARVAWGFLAAVLLARTSVRAHRRVMVLAGPEDLERTGGVASSMGGAALALVGASGGGAAALAAGTGGLSALVLGAGIVLVSAAGALRWGARGPAAVVLGAAAGTAALTALAWVLLEALGGTEPGAGATAPDLASRLWPGATAFALRLGMASAALALLLLLRRVPGRDGEGRELWAWAGIALGLAGAAAHDTAALALPLLAASAAAWVAWAGGRKLSHPLLAAVLAVGAALLGAAVWETAARIELKRELGATFLPYLAPPEADELRAVRSELAEHFRTADLARRVPRSLDGLEREDLAFFVWRESPLARANALSALVVEPYEGGASVFSVGPPVAASEGPAWSATPADDWSPPVWNQALTSGEAVLSYAGTPWATVRYWLLPRPGFGLTRAGALEPLELGLLRGRETVEVPVRGLPEPAVYSLYGERGRALVSPWPEEPPLPLELSRDLGSGEAPRRRVETPAGPAWAWARQGRDGIEVLFLPVRLPGPALERVGSHALGSLATGAALAALLVLLALPRPAFRALLGRTLRSYSKRLIVVFTVLLLLPLLLLNLVLLKDAEERLNREQRAAGEAAMVSAQRVIGDYVASFDPGFGFATLVDDALLMWVSRVVHHEVNLYWGSSVWASSKPELFAADLLPERIPGEVYSRLTLRGYDLASRTHETGGIEYVELYAPLRIPGAPVAQERIFLSLPLLAQQEEVARELESLRRRVILVSAGLFGLLIVVGVGFARRFSQPIEELVAGTRRIAAGAPSLDLAPSELELAALVDAVDEMAGRIAESRAHLVREKQVVERMVENITSGVVSLDHERRVLMHNRVAAELLGVGVGERLDEAVARRPRLAPVAAFLDGADRRFARATIRLPGPEDGDDREWSLVWVPVPGAGEPTALLVVEDATEVLRGQRLQAWAEMARIIAHEIKNPLTPLRLSTEHLREVYRGGGDGFDEVFERCTTNILRQVEELRVIATEFSAFSSIPRIEPKTGDLTAAMQELVEVYRGARSQGVEVLFEHGGGEVLARFDARLLGRAVRNLIENAVRATAGGGRVTVRVWSEDGTAAVSVLDSGPGVSPELLGRIFEPYFSTHDAGTGLGLPIARRIAEEHGGSIGAHNRPGGGLEVTIRIPS